jgi:hypothetical protein
MKKQNGERGDGGEREKSQKRDTYLGVKPT